VGPFSTSAVKICASKGVTFDFSGIALAKSLNIPLGGWRMSRNDVKDEATVRTSGNGRGPEDV
jgi:hypothetical protein